MFFFFFSSRRRHTRLTCDWSSDVCSSDLLGAERPAWGGARHVDPVAALDARRRLAEDLDVQPVDAGAGLSLEPRDSALHHSVDLIRDLDAPAPQDEIHAFPLPGCDEPPPG